jgi:hypothetical protein
MAKGKCGSSFGEETDIDIETKVDKKKCNKLGIYTTLTAFVIWSEFLATDPVDRVLFPALPLFLRSSGSGTGSTQPREYN